MKKLYAYFFTTLSACVLISMPASAQTPSQLRQMRQNAADSSGNSSQQNSHQSSASERHRSKQQNQQDSKVFGDDDPMFATTDVPDKWKNESAVILGAKVDYNYYTKSGGYNLDETVRTRIKLLDKAAVDDYSTFYFTSSPTGTTEAGFRIIKKDGTTTTVDLSKAVSQGGSDVPIYELLPGGYASVEYKKIPISNLEPGDIIDYYYQFNFTVGTPARYGNYVEAPEKATAFPIELFKLPSTFPTVSQKVDFQVERGFYINFGSYNGAPGLIESNDVSHRVKVFSFIDNDREKAKDERYEYDYRSEPTIKFQVVYTSQSYQDEVNYFLSKPFIPLTEVTEDMAQKVANRMALESDNEVEKNADLVIKYMRMKHGNVRDNVKYMEYAYYYFRYLVLSKMASTKYQYENNPDHQANIPGWGYTSKAGRAYLNNSAADYYSEEREKFLNGSVSDDAFVKTMGLVCRDRKMDYEFLFTVPRNIGTLDNLLLTAETTWVLHIKGSPDIYFYPFDRFKNPNEGIGTVEGADAYVISPNRNSRVAKMDREKLPTSQYMDNSYSYNITASLTSAMDGDAVVKRTANVTGLSKNYYYPEAVIEDQYENADIVRYRNSSDELTDNEFVAKLHNEKKHDEAVRKLKESIDEENKDRLDKMKDDAKEDYSIDTYDDYKLIADGREADSTTLIFNESFKVKDMVKKAGPNYLVNVGALIGTQPNIKDTELDRQYDIYLNYPSTVTNQIVFTIPDGYKVDGITNLNTNVTNATGGFISSASVSGNKLTIKSQKYFANNYQPKSSWPDMVKFLRAAYDFSQKKVLLKKA